MFQVMRYSQSHGAGVSSCEVFTGAWGVGGQVTRCSYGHGVGVSSCEV